MKTKDSPLLSLLAALIIGVVLGSFLISSSYAHAATVPTILGYQGRLANSSAILAIPTALQ